MVADLVLQTQLNVLQREYDNLTHKHIKAVTWLLTIGAAIRAYLSRPHDYPEDVARNKLEQVLAMAPSASFSGLLELVYEASNLVESIESRNRGQTIDEELYQQSQKLKEVLLNCMKGQDDIHR